jgi:hypothetical protein
MDKGRAGNWASYADTATKAAVEATTSSSAATTACVRLWRY